MLLIKPPLSLAHRGNMTLKSLPAQVLPDEKSSSFPLFTPRDIFPAILASANVLILLVNLRVIHIVYSRLSKRIKIRFSVSVLVVHLSLTCIGITTLSALNTSQSDHLLNMFGSGVREVSEFLKDSITCAFSINVLLLVYERVRTVSNFHKSLLVFRILAMMWSLAITQGFFTTAMTYQMKPQLVEYKLHAQISGITCEVIRFFIFHIGVGTSISNALVKIRSKLSQLPISCQKLKTEVENIRSFYIQLCIFVIVWITYGVWYATLRCAFFLEFDLEQHSTLKDYVELGFHTYLTLNPMMHVHLLDNDITTCPGCMSTKGHFKRDENFEEETANETMDNEPNTTIGITSSGVIEDGQGVKSSGSCTVVREKSSSAIKYGRHQYNPPPQTYVQVHFVETPDIEHIDADSDKESSSDEGEYEVIE